MQPGRELDAKVASAMGIEFVRIMVGEDPWAREILMLVGAGCKCNQCEKTGNVVMVHGPLMHGMVYPEVRPYSTDIAAAWEVVEKLALTFELGWLPADKGLNWDASFGEKRGSEDGTTTYADTAPHAICLSALKAIA